MTVMPRKPTTAKQAAADRYRKRVLPPAPNDPATRTVTATVEAVVFANSEGDFAILRAVGADDSRVVLQGGLAHVHVGETLECEGEWK